MQKARKIWGRFLALGIEQQRLDAAAIGQKPERLSLLVNCFGNDGIRRARALQLLQDLQKVLEEEGIALQEFIALQDSRQ